MDLIVFTGPKGSGKTTAAITAGNPTTTLVIDTENSASDFLSQVDMPHYHSMYDAIVDDNLDLLGAMASSQVMPWAGRADEAYDIKVWNWFSGVLDTELRGNKIKTVVIDTGEVIERAMAAEVEANKNKYGWASKAFGGMETKGVRPLYAMLIEGIRRRGVDKLVITTHLRTPWAKQGKESVPLVGKVTPSGRLKVLSMMSSMMVWLVAGDNPDGSPAGLVMKARAGKHEYKGGKWTSQAMFPQRFPSFTWAEVDLYRKHPADRMNPAPGETPSEGEMNMLSEVLTDEQMKLMILGAEERMAAGELTETQRVMAFKEMGMSPAEIAEETGLKMPEIRKILA